MRGSFEDLVEQNFASIHPIVFLILMNDRSRIATLLSCARVLASGLHRRETMQTSLTMEGNDDLSRMVI
jgi:hypothetical protein